MANEATPTTFEKVMEGVKLGTVAMTALVPFLTGGSAVVRQVVEAWRVGGMTREEILAHIEQSEADVREVIAWLDEYEPKRHPGSALPS